MRKVDEREAVWIVLLNSVGLGRKAIADNYNFKYMDVANVLRGNSFSNITGILHHSISQEDVIAVKRLLKQDHPYRDIAVYAGYEDNKVRNIMGYLQYEGVI